MTSDATRLVMGHAIRGTTADGLDDALAYRLGRALGTLVRRRCAGGREVVVARTDATDRLAELRAGLVRGLVLTGHAVLDGGVLDVDTARRLVESVGAGAFLTREGEVCALHPFLGVGDTVESGADPRPAREVCELADAGEWSAFEGSLELMSRGAVAAAIPEVGAVGR